MGTYRKSITMDCDKCNDMKVNENSQMVCKWGKTEKILLPQKGKKPLTCKLNR